ncbi:hypothetical protein FDG2_6334 [Candidatus Protofrankia californiensis]|uniref:Uncharacterized protein n=1 Tax=Candidatus Protofrankia californiensis TaxID=1839754 RepID=A0A1C3PGQ4_9ACTN|nr:hypothetical protein FDG2_6334 [Candidatus Protofrankia californiensis]
MRIRLRGTPAETAAVADLLVEHLTVVDRSAPYPDRSGSGLVRIYLDVTVPDELSLPARDEETTMPRFHRTINIASGNARVGMQIGDTSASVIRGRYDQATSTLTYTCPACGKKHTDRGRAFVRGVQTNCGCGQDLDVYV